MHKTIAIQRVHVRGEYLELSTEIPDNVQDLVGNAEYLTNMGCGLQGLVDSIWKVLCSAVQYVVVFQSATLFNRRKNI